MKKFLRVIILALVLVFTCSFCLTACDDKSSGSASLAKNVEKKYVPEIADIYLSIMGMDSSNQGYAEVKAEVTNSFGAMMTKEVKDAVNYIGDKILTPAGCTDKVISNFIGSTKEFIISSLNFNKVASEQFGEDYDALVDDGKTVSGMAMSVAMDPQGALGYLPYIRDGVVTATTDAAGRIGELDEDGRTAVLEAIKDLVEGYNGFIGAIDGQVLAAVVLNLATADFEKLMAKLTPVMDMFMFEDEDYADDDYYFDDDDDDYGEDGYEYNAVVLNDDLTTIGAEEENPFSFIETAVKAIGLDKKAVKNAYKTIIGIQINKVLRTLSLEKISLDHIVDLVSCAIEDTDEDQTVAITNLIAKAETVLKDIGAQVSYTAYTETEVNDFIAACNTLNKAGLGYYAERVMPVLRYDADFAGHFISSLSIVKLMPLAQDFEQAGGPDFVGNVKAILELIEVFANAEQGSAPMEITPEMFKQLAEALVGPIVAPDNDGTNNAIIRLATIYNDALNSYKNKDKYVAALKTAIGNDVVTTYFELIDEISNMDLVDYDAQAQEPSDPTGVDTQELPNTAITKLMAFYTVAEVDIQGYIDAADKVVEYFAPIGELLSMVFVEY